MVAIKEINNHPPVVAIKEINNQFALASRRIEGASPQRKSSHRVKEKKSSKLYEEAAKWAQRAS